MSCYTWTSTFWENSPKKYFFQNHLQQKVVEDFLCFQIRCKAEIISFHEHLKSFNSTDSSLRHRSKREWDTIRTCFPLKLPHKKTLCFTHAGSDISATNQSNWMILGSRESWRSLLYNESKNIENVSAVFAGDDFEKIFVKIKFRT